MSENTEKKKSILPEFEEIEKTWIVAVLAQPNMKPTRAANLFVHRFDRFLELSHPVDTVVKAVVEKFYYYRSDDEAALYKPIQAKKELYNEVFEDLIDTYFITDYFELMNYMEEVYLGIEEYSSGKLKVLKDAANLRGLLYKPKQEDTEDSPSEVGWVRERSISREEKNRIDAERDRIKAEKANAETEN